MYVSYCTWSTGSFGVYCMQQDDLNHPAECSRFPLFCTTTVERTFQAIMEATSKRQQKKGKRQHDEWLIASLGEVSTHFGSDDTYAPLSMHENPSHLGEGSEHVGDLRERLIGSNISSTANGAIPLLETSKPVLELVAPAD